MTEMRILDYRDAAVPHNDRLVVTRQRRRIGGTEAQPPDSATASWPDQLTQDQPADSLESKCARLEKENAKLRWYIKDIRRTLERVPDHSLPRSIRFKQWGQQTLIEMATRTAPRIAVIWGGAAAAAYVVHLIVS